MAGSRASGASRPTTGALVSINSHPTAANTSPRSRPVTARSPARWPALWGLISQTEKCMRAGSRWKRFRRRLRYWLDHNERQRLLWEEMEFHIASMIDELIGQGMSEPEAIAAAYRKFGNMTQTSEESRSTWIARWMGDLTQDLRHSFRGMRRDAGFTAFTILIAGLGIGASTTVFSVVNALLLRPLPFRDPGRLVWITNGDDFTTTQAEHYSDLRDLNQSFSDLAGWGTYGVGDRELTGIGEPE